MNIRQLINAATSNINLNQWVIIKQSSGYEISDGGRQAPVYTQRETLAQIQALTAQETKQIDGVSQNDVVCSIYVSGLLRAVDRDVGSGGDLVILSDQSVWLVIHLLEVWNSWTRAVIVKQI